jgi:hypothetical protein
MSKDGIDASVGLAFSLKLFHHYRGSGILQAKVHRVPGVQGQGMAYLHLTQGTVVACYIDDLRGQRYHFAPDVLCRIDKEKGPFEWTFQTLPLPQAPDAASPETPQPQPTLTSPSSFSDTCIPKVVASLSWEPLNHWTLAQKQILYTIWRFIDGKRSIREIKASVALSPEVVNEVMRTLEVLHVIAISSQPPGGPRYYE